MHVKGSKIEYVEYHFKSAYAFFLTSLTCRFDRSDSEKYVKESHEIMQQNRSIPPKE